MTRVGIPPPPVYIFTIYVYIAAPAGAPIKGGYSEDSASLATLKNSSKLFKLREGFSDGFFLFSEASRDYNIAFV